MNKKQIIKMQKLFLLLEIILLQMFAVFLYRAVKHTKIISIFNQICVFNTHLITLNKLEVFDLISYSRKFRINCLLWSISIKSIFDSLNIKSEIVWSVKKEENFQAHCWVFADTIEFGRLLEYKDLKHSI